MNLTSCFLICCTILCNLNSQEPDSIQCAKLGIELEAILQVVSKQEVEINTKSVSPIFYDCFISIEEDFKKVAIIIKEGCDPNISAVIPDYLGNYNDSHVNIYIPNTDLLEEIIPVFLIPTEEYISHEEFYNRKNNHSKRQFKVRRYVFGLIDNDWTLIEIIE